MRKQLSKIINPTTSSLTGLFHNILNFLQCILPRDFTAKLFNNEVLAVGVTHDGPTNEHKVANGSKMKEKKSIHPMTEPTGSAPDNLDMVGVH